MKLPNWLKITWWILLTTLLTLVMFKRSPDLLAGRAVPADIVIFVIWIALLLAPLFNEVSVLGITLKQEIDDLKKFVSSQVNDVRNELRNNVDARASVNQQFTIPAPAPDAQLPAIEAKINQAISEAFSSQGFQQHQVEPLAAPEDASFLFAARYNIERELRRIADEDRRIVWEWNPSATRRPLSISQLTRHLTESEQIEQRLANAIREVYAICSPAIHGEQVTDAQIAFVKDVAPELVAALKAIKWQHPTSQ